MIYLKDFFLQLRCQITQKTGGSAIDPMFVWHKFSYTNSSLGTWMEVLEESVKTKSHVRVSVVANIQQKLKGKLEVLTPIL